MEPFGFDNPGAAPAKDGPIDSLGVLAALRGRKRWIDIPTLLSFTAALAFVMLVAPSQAGIATVLLATLAGFVLSAGVAIARASLAGAPNREAAAEPVFATASSSWTSPEALAKRAEAAELPPSVGGIVDAFADAAGARMALLVTGEASPAALAVAVAAARRLAKRGPAALLDLGATQPWLADVLDHSNSEALFGLTDVLDGRASFDQALHRDLSTSLDILPAGRGEIEQSMLAPVLEFLAKTYAYVVVHASDWRAPPGCAAIGAVDAAIVCAPAGRVEAATQRLRDTFADSSVLTEGVAAGGGRARFDRAA